MKIAILSEGSDDTLVLKGLVERILSSELPGTTPLIPREKLLFLPPLEAHTTILNKMDAAPLLFFDGKEKADVIIFGVDLDNLPGRRAKVRTLVRSERNKGPHRIIIPLFVDPHIERIFFEDSDTSLRRVLTRIPVHAPIPFESMEPKNRLARLIGEYGPLDVTLTRKEIYRALTESLNLDALCQVRGGLNFRSFKYDLLASVKR